METTKEVANATNGAWYLEYEELCSPIFTFIVGEDRVLFRVHSLIFKLVSEPLHNLIHCGMVETKKMEVVLEDTDPLIFAALVEYAYTGYCYGAEDNWHELHDTDITKASSTPTEENLLDRTDNEGAASPSSKPPQSKSASTPYEANIIWTCFESLSRRFDYGHNVWFTFMLTRDGDEKKLADSNMIRFYISVVVMTDKWLMKNLQDYAILWIHSALSWNSKHSVSLDYMLKILKDNLSDSDICTEVRNILLFWLASYSQDILANKEFKEVLREHPDITVEILDIVSKHIKTRETGAQGSKAWKRPSSGW